MNFFDFIQWVLGDLFRFIGFLILLAVAGELLVELARAIRG